MANCFSFVSTKPGDLQANDSTEINDKIIQNWASECQEIIFAWGAFDIVKEKGRDKWLSEKFPDAEALIINKDGSPRHPLYVKGDCIPVKFTV